MTTKWADGKNRCAWANPNNPEYVKYHDTEWGRAVHDDARLFEMLLLESFQAGLSWECILNKRENFRRAFDGFDAHRIAEYTDADARRLMADAGIIRNRLKIRAAIKNARVFLEIVREFGSFDAYIWRAAGGAVICEAGCTHSEISDAISHDLRRRGMRFVGTTIIYAYLQAIGIINGHSADCWCIK